jgi:hypothetical protein
MPAPLYSAPTPQASKTVTIKTPHLATAAILVGAVALGALVIAVIALRRGVPDTTLPAPTQSAANVAAPAGGTAATDPAGAAPGSASATPQTPSSTPATGAAPSAGQTTPASAPAAPAVPASPAATPVTPPATAARPAGATATQAPSTAAAAGAASSAEGAPRPAGGRRGAPVTSPPDPASARGTTVPATPAPPAAVTPDLPTETFDDVRLLIVENGRSREVEAKLTLTGSRLEVRAGWDNSVLRSVAYSSIAAETYVRGRRPRGETGEGIFPVPEVGGGGLFGGARHWLTVQTAAEFLIVRLEDRNVIRVLTLLGQRTGREIRRDNK